MKTRLIVSFLLCTAFVTGMTFVEGAMAQISTNLDALPPSPETPKPTAHQTNGRGVNISGAHSSSPPYAKATISTIHRHTQPLPSPPGYTTVPSVPVTAPRNSVIAPPFVPVQKHPPVPPEEVKADPTAKSSYVTLGPHDDRVLFDAQSAKINQATLNEIAALAKILAEDPTKRIRLESYAMSVNDDASLPRRISLERAIIIRSLLMLNNVASTRIYPIAHGAANVTDKNPPDRVDIHILANPVKIEDPAIVTTGPHLQAPAQNLNPIKIGSQ